MDTMATILREIRADEGFDSLFLARILVIN